MPAFSATRGHLGPGYGQPVQELRPVRLTEGCGKLYNPVSTSMYKRSVPTPPHTLEMLERQRAERWSPRNSVSPDAAEFNGGVTPPPLMTDRVSPETILESFVGGVQRPLARRVGAHSMHRAAPDLTSFGRPGSSRTSNPASAGNSSPRAMVWTSQQSSRPQSTPPYNMLRYSPRQTGTWSRGDRFNDAGQARAREMERQRVRRQADYCGLSPRSTLRQTGPPEHSPPFVPEEEEKGAFTQGDGLMMAKARRSPCGKPPGRRVDSTQATYTPRGGATIESAAVSDDLQRARPERASHEAPILQPTLRRPEWRRPASPRPAFY